MSATPLGDGSQDRLERVVQRALELEEQGVEVSVDELCCGDAELARIAREVLAQRARVVTWAADHAAENALVGRLLAGRYRLRSAIGAGAMGSVYRAFDAELKRDVAVKLVHSFLLGPTAAARFLREAEVLARVRHPHVVTVHDRGCTDDGRHFLVMELLDGVSLSTVLAELEARLETSSWADLRRTDWLPAGLPSESSERSYVRWAARCAADLAAGLSAAHEAGVFHRDVKPSNVFLVPGEGPRLLDFGIAALSADAGLTRPGTTLGTPRYMAPEQAARSVEPNPQLDVYSLAATLYHVLAGRGPYQGDTARVLAALQREDPAPLVRWHRGLPRDLQAIVECGMARDPRRRYASAAAMEADLRAFLDHEPIVARPTGPVRRALRRLRRSRTARAAALVVLAGALALGGAQWHRAAEQARQAGILDARKHLAPALTLGRWPVVVDPGARVEQAALLDRILALAPDDLVARCRRAAFRHDHGDPRGAAEDAAALARYVPGACASALAERYAAAAERGTPVDLQALPAPSSPGERLLAGFHALRRLDYATAAELLGHPDNTLAARSLGLIARLQLGLDRGDNAALEQVQLDALEIERTAGAETALLHLVVGSVAVHFGRAAEAVQRLEASLALQAHSLPTLLNVANAYYELGDLDAAEDALRRAIAVQPASAKALGKLAMVEADRGRFEDALATAARIPASHDQAWRGHEAAAYTEFRRTLVLLQDGDVDGARAAAERAVEHYRAVLDLASDERRERLRRMLRINVAVCRALIDGDWDRFCRHLLALPPEYPRRVVLLNLAEKLPGTLDASLTTAVRSFLRREAQRSR